jgi:hypothetical protein
MGHLSAEQAVANGDARLEGDAEAAARAWDILDIGAGKGPQESEEL